MRVGPNALDTAALIGRSPANEDSPALPKDEPDASIIGNVLATGAGD